MIHIAKPVLCTRDGKSRVSADISIDGKTQSLWFEVDQKYEKYLCHERSDAFVLGMMQLAFRHGHDIRCEAPMTERLYEQLTEQFLPAFDKINKLKTRIIAPVALEVDHPEGGDHIGTGVSCGVDSLHVFCAHPELDTACLWSAGLSEGAKSRAEMMERFEMLRKRSEAFARYVDVNFLVAETNYDRGAFPNLTWDGMTTQGNLFCIFAMQKYWKKYYVAGEVDIVNYKFKVDSVWGDPARYEYFLFPHVSLGKIQIRLDGCAQGRVDKVGDLVHYEPARKFLNVCWRDNEDRKNGTNDCPKCMRTLLNLDAHRAVDDFSEVFDVGYFHKYQHEYLAEYYRGLLQNDAYYTEMIPYFRHRKFPVVLKLRAWLIVVKKIIKKFLRGGKTKIGGFSSRG